MSKLAPPPKRKTNLSAFQAAMAEAVMQPLDSGESMQRQNAETATQLVKPNDRLNAFERLQIYNQQYWWRLLSAFGDDFRGLRAVIGERRFKKLAIAYLDKCGSTSWNLRNLGQHLEGFLQTHLEYAMPYAPLALDMIRIEWARIIAFDGPQKPPLDPKSMEGCKPSGVRIGLQPFISLLELKYPVDHLLRRLKRTESAATSNAVSSGLSARRHRLSARPAPQIIHLAVHRIELSVYYKRLEPEAFRLLDSLRTGANLEAACEKAFLASPLQLSAIAKNIQTWFTAWTRFGWLCAR